MRDRMGSSHRPEFHHKKERIPYNADEFVKSRIHQVLGVNFYVLC